MTHAAPTQWDGTCPYEIRLDGSGEPLQCQRAVRTIRGKRVVCQAHWRGRPVYVKVFLDPRRAAEHLRRELRGLRAMQACGIATPAVLHHGTAAAGVVHLIVLEEVAAARSMLEAWNAAGSDVERAELVRDMARLLALHHRHGLLQRDLHLNNFLLSHGRIYTLDGGTVRVAHRPVGRYRSLANLGLFLAQRESHGWTCGDFRPAFVAATKQFAQPLEDEALNRASVRRMKPFFLLQNLHNNAFSFLAARFGLRGTNASCAGFSAASTPLLELAAQAVTRGDVDGALVVGAARMSGPVFRHELNALPPELRTDSMSASIVRELEWARKAANEANCRP